MCLSQKCGVLAKVMLMFVTALREFENRATISVNVSFRSTNSGGLL